MEMLVSQNGLVLFGTALMGLVLGGCGGSSTTQPAAPTTPAATAHDHSGWWCTEHGIPEEECALCNATLAADFQKKGDWCQTHNRPDSQCFICHPELEAKFAAKYEAKYGTKPPKPESATP
jgi:hypothetical protein